MHLEIWIKIWFYLNLVLTGIKTARPRFDTSTDMGNVLVPADAEVDSVIYRLRATDQDVDFPLVFEVTATVQPVVRIENLPCTLYNKVCQANVILTRRLTAGRLHDFAVRVRDSKGDSNSMQATITVMNATTPRDKIFPHIPALIMVPEDAKPGKELDYILVRSNPWIGKPVYIELWQPKELFTIRQRQDSSNTKGVITLIGELDFETQSMYTLTIYATDPYTERQRDTRNIAGLHLIVIVQDVQDVPPIFTLAPPLTKINNTVQPGDIILRVHAEDGDKGVPREITYGLVSEGNPFTPFFNITESTGEIILTRPLEELTQITHVGAPIVLSVVAEEIRRSTDEPPAQATVVEVGLLLGEPGNSPPYFENDNYVAWMDENSEPGSSIVFNEPYSTRVRDEDIGKAGVFALKLENNNGTFEISPAVAERTANFILTVRDNSLIDYETFKSLKFQITAQEVGPATNLSATVPVTIFLRDVNDNPPEFQEESYEVTLSENVTAGTRVVQVHATDKDTGAFGRIQYTRIIGSGSEAFVINPDTGVITVAMGTSILDREITPQLMLTVEACDEDGKGLRGTVPFIVNLIDANDNAPVFEKDAYEFTLNSELTNFTSPAIIKAFDADAEPPNNVIHYEIIHGNYENKFYLDENTGELFLREQITKVRNARHNSYQRFSSNYRKKLIKAQNYSTTSKPEDTTRENETNSSISRRKREDKNIVFTLTARAYDLGVPHLSSTTQIKILQLPLAGVTTIMLLVPGENPDREKTTKALETITGGKITIKDIRPYTLENLPKDYPSNLPVPDGKKSIVVAQVEQKSPGASFVDIEKVLSALTANGFGIIGGDMTGNGTQDPKDNGGGKNGTITTIHNEEVIVYKAENKLLFWLLIILGLLILAAIIILIICCICPGCLLYMAPRKRRIHSSETLIARADNRPRRHLHRQPAHTQLESVWVEKKQAWSADLTRNNWQFNRRNTKNFGIASLPGDVRIDRDRQLKASSLQLHEPPVPVYLIEPREERIFVEDFETRKAHGTSHHEFERDDLRQAYMQGRDSHFYRDGNSEVMRLMTRDEANHITVERRAPEIVIDQSALHRVDGKDILLRRFMEDQKLREHEYDLQEERHSMESHKRQKDSMQKEILLIPERLDERHIEEVGPDIQRLIIDHGPEKSQDVLIHGSTSKISDKEQKIHYSIHDLELARQNALLTRLLLEKDRGVGGVIVDTGSYLETQSLPGQVAAGTQTNQTTATQTEGLNRSRSDNESEDDGRLRRKRSKKRYDEPKRIRTLWMRSPIHEEEHQYPERHGNFLRKKIKDIKDGRKSSIEQEVLREISDSLDETGEIDKRHNFVRDGVRDDSSSMEVLKDEKKESGKKEPSFRILEREMSSLSKKLSKLAGKTLTKCKEDSNLETDKFLTTDSQEKEGEKMDKIEIIKSRSRSTQRVTKSTQLKIPKETEKSKFKAKYRKNPVISTGSSEMEEADKPVKKTAKKSDEDKFSVGKSIKSRLKRQANVEDKKPVEKQKTLMKQLKKPEVKAKKSSDSCQAKEVTNFVKSSESERDSNKLMSSSMKQSSSSAASKESRTKEKKIKPKMNLQVETDFKARGAKSTDSESMKSDKSSRKQSGSSKKSSVVTSPELGRFKEKEEANDSKKVDVRKLDEINLKKESMEITTVMKNLENEKIERVTSPESLGKLTPKDEKSQSRGSPVEKIIGHAKEKLEKVETAVMKHVDNIKETVEKITDGVNVNVIEKVKDFVDSRKVSPEHALQTKEAVIDRKSGSGSEDSPKKIEELRISGEKLIDDKQSHVEPQEVSEKELIEVDKKEESNLLEKSINVQKEIEEKLIEKIDDSKLVKVDPVEDEMISREVNEEKQVNESIKEEKTEDSSTPTSSTPKIVTIAPINESKDPKDDSESQNSTKTILIINIENEDDKTSNLIESPDKLLQESKEKLEVIAQNAKAEETIDNQKTEDTSSESKTSQLQVEGSLSPVSQRSRRSSQVIISRETSFLNSPKRLPKDEIEGREPADSIISEPKAESPVVDKEIEVTRVDNTLANEQPQSIGAETTELETSLPFDDKHEHSDSTFDPLDDDSDVSSESSTKTAFIARPYGTPRHRRLVRMDHVERDEKKVASMEDDKEEILKVEASQVIDDKMEDKEVIGVEEKELEKVVEVKEEMGESNSVDDKEEIAEEVKDSKNDTSKPLVEVSDEKSVKTQEEPEKVEINLQIDNEKLVDVDSNSLTGLESVKNLGSGLKVLEMKDAKSLDQFTNKKQGSKVLEVKGKAGEASKQKVKNIKIIPLSKGTKLPVKEKDLDKSELIKSSGDRMRPRENKMKASKSEELKLPGSRVKSLDRKRVEHEKTVQPEKIDDKKVSKVSVESKLLDKQAEKKKNNGKKLLMKEITSKSQKISSVEKGKASEVKVDKKIEKQEVKSQKSEGKEVIQVKREKNVTPEEEKIKVNQIKEDKIVTQGEVTNVSLVEKEQNIIDKKEEKNIIESKVTHSEEVTQDKEEKVNQSEEIKTEDTSVSLKKDSVTEKIDMNAIIKETTTTEEKQVVTVVEKEVQVAIRDLVQEIVDKTVSKVDQVTKNGVVTTVEEKSTEKVESTSEKIESTSQVTKEETKSSSHDSKQRDRSLSPSKVNKYGKEDYTEAQSRYMEWYKQNREEAERRKLEKKEGDEEEEPPKWLRRSTRQRWLKMSPEDRKVFEVRTPEITPLTRRRIKPLVNIESEQLKAIVRQGRKLRKAEGDMNLDPPIEIFAPEKPPPVQQQPQQPKYHYLLQHSEYQYQRMPPPFYLHPPPVPHPTPQVSPQRFEVCQEQFSSTSEPHLHESVGTLQTGTRLRHQQLLEKKSVFDIAYDEAAPSQLRADSTTPPS